MNMGKGMSVFSAHNIATLGILTALVIVFQLFLANFLVVGGTSFCLVLIPIVLGSVLLGAWAGAFLGFVFSSIVFFSGLFGLEASAHVQIMIQTNWPLTFSIIYLKGVMAGLVPGFVFEALKGKNRHAAVFVSSISAPVVNTGIYILGMLSAQKVFFASYEEFTSIVFSSVILINFTVELAINIIANPAIYTVINAIENKKQEGNL